MGAVLRLVLASGACYAIGDPMEIAASKGCLSCTGPGTAELVGLGGLGFQPRKQ